MASGELRSGLSIDQSCQALLMPVRHRLRLLVPSIRTHPPDTSGGGPVTKPWLAHRSLLLGTLLAVSLVAAPASAQAAGPGSRSALPTAARSQLVPVWAFINGDVPVAGARVLIIAGGRPVRLLNVGASARTNTTTGLWC